MISKQLTILLAADDCSFFQSALEDMPLNSHLATVPDSDQLLRHLEGAEKSLPDLIFIDFNNKKKNGIRCLSELKRNKRTKNIPVIVFSGTIDERLADLLYQKQAHFYLHFPADYSCVRKVIRQALAWILLADGDIVRPRRGKFVRSDFDTHEMDFENNERYKMSAALMGIKIELKKMTSLFESVVEGTPIAMVLVDRNGIITLVNKQAEKLFGYQRDELIGNSFDILIPNRFSRQYPHYRNMFFKKPRMFSMGSGNDLFITTKNGEKIQVETGIDPIETPEGLMVLASIIDITERKTREYTLLKQNEVLNIYAHITSHDLQEPLRKIQTFVNLMMEKENDNLSGSGKDYLRRTLNTAGRMRKLLDDLLAYSRSRTTIHKFEYRHLGDIVNEVKIELNHIIEEKQAIIETNELCTARVIPFLFRQLLNNLILNALKFSKTDVIPYIIIKSKNARGSELPFDDLSPEKNYCHIMVMDNGIGFDQQNKDSIFVVFQKLHRKEEYPGTGIGLAIVKNIVESHDGYVTATGELNKGATFDIIIPG